MTARAWLEVGPTSDCVIHVKACAARATHVLDGVVFNTTPFAPPLEISCSWVSLKTTPTPRHPFPLILQQADKRTGGHICTINLHGHITLALNRLRKAPCVNRR